MIEAVCPCCGQTMPRAYDFYLPPGHNLIFEYVRKAGKNGIRSDRLFAKLYGNRGDGGPGFKTLAARIYYLNNRYLYPRGLKIKADHNGGWEFSNYRLMDVV